MLAEAAVDVVGKRDRLDQCLAVGVREFGHRDQPRNHVARVAAALSEIGVAHVERPRHHAVHERGDIGRAGSVPAPDARGPARVMVGSERARHRGNRLIVSAERAGDGIHYMALHFVPCLCTETFKRHTLGKRD